MSTRINTNVTAYSAAQNLQMNSNKLSQNIQRLSSGLRINSAADDPAGLVISENFKSQISGLNQATQNSNDAINEVKTAEGALNEVQSLLISVRQLAVHASNVGVNSSVDVAADQAQINSAIASINRIAGTTSFGDKKLLDGSATSALTTTAGTAVAAGTQFTVAAQGAWNVSNAHTYTNNTITGATSATETFATSLSSGSAGTFINASNTGQFAGSVTINGTAYTLSTAGKAASLTDLNAAIATSGYQATVTNSGQLSFSSQVAGSLSSSPSIDLSNLKIGGNNAITVPGSAVTASGGTAVSISSAAGEASGTALVPASITANAGSALTFTVNGAAQTLSVTAGETLASINTALQATGLTVGMDATNKTIQLTSTADANVTITGGNLVLKDGTNKATIDNTAAGTAGTADVATMAANAPIAGGTLTTATATFAGTLSVTGVNGSSTALTLSAGTSLAQLNTQLSSLGVTASIAAGGVLSFQSSGTAGAVTVNAGSNFTAYNSLGNATGQFTNGTNASLSMSDSAGHTITSTSEQTVGSQTYFSFANGLTVGTTVSAATGSTATLTGTLTSTQGTSTQGQDLQFQIGAMGGQTASISIGSVASNQIGKGAASYTDANGNTQTVTTASVADLNVLDQKGAQDAIAVIDKAISDISTLRSSLGAFQSNVLQSNVNSLGVAQTNMNSSLSTIEDTDLSSEIVDYTKNQILVQAGTSALSQANQAPQAILKLLQ